MDSFSNSQWNFLVALAEVGAIPPIVAPGATIIFYVNGQPGGWSMGGTYFSPGTIGEKQVERLTAKRELGSSSIVLLDEGESMPALPDWTAEHTCSVLNKHFSSQRMFSVGQEDVLARLGIRHDCGGWGSRYSVNEA